MTKKPVLSYYRVLSVQVPDKKLFEYITSEFCGYAEGDTNSCIAWDDFISQLDDAIENDLPDNNKELYEFLLEVRKKAKGEIGDVVFWRDE